MVQPAVREGGDPVAAVSLVEPSVRETVARATEEWARFWSEQRVDEFLDSYAADFELPPSLDQSAWRYERRTRLLSPLFIRVIVDDLVVEVRSDDLAIASFSQAYQSDTYSDEVRKSLTWGRVGESWKILVEATLPP